MTSMSNMNAEQIAAMSQSMANIAGRGMFYGAAASGGRKRIFSQTDWSTCCEQAVSWGMKAVHPKVADGGYWWYSEAELLMLHQVAASKNLVCYPYHYCYGDKFGALDSEAAIAVKIGQIFGGVCPDMEIEYEQSPNGGAWATKFGTLVRASFKGPVLPTLFGNPAAHKAFPYLQVLHWASGWMPMAYYDLWTNSQGKQMTASDAVDYLYGQWIALNKTLVNQGIFPPPILPLIEVGDHLPVAEVASWLRQMKNYGYCGFWYDGIYSPYASTVKQSPEPAWPTMLTTMIKATITPMPTTRPTTPASGATPSPTASSSSSSTTQTQIGQVMGIQQILSPEELQFLWSRYDQTIPYVPKNGIPELWSRLVQAGYGIGSPITSEKSESTSTISCTSQEFQGGTIFYNKATGKVWVLFVTTNARIPGTMTA